MKNVSLLRLAALTAFFCLSCGLAGAGAGSPLSGRVVVIDPGHGGDDPGALGCHGIVEKDVAMEIARKVALAFREAGAQVVLTRDGDLDPEGRRVEIRDLPRRVELANRCRAHLFLSIHLNHFSEPDEYGAQVFYQCGSVEGRKLAEAIQAELNRHLVDVGRQALGGDFYVCRNARMPAVIVEVGFLSHEEESRRLTDPEYQERAARAILEGVARYLQGNREEVR
ncbi:N-acetylmuramoyl-L-alanine amidase family protein [Desulfovirgula thermocuniculi]|uniref:N-acetylmuramoyl-L-alanine amidase family protein n=1 Tax=Desulfovirgula thermocuniculi TaxID=348842 RepID=UPI00040EAF29|nr:N-acetylmuramoyl-L-alanine amidase [Desulfovirgula thermocuniculi]